MSGRLDRVRPRLLDRGFGKAPPARRSRLLALSVAASVLLIGCGGSDGDQSDAGGQAGSTDAPESNEQGVEIVTIADLSLELPIEVPGNIPAPSDGVYVGDVPAAAPWTTFQIGSAVDPTELRAAVRSFAESEPGARFDEAIEQATFETDVNGERWSFSVWVRTTDGNLPTLLEIGGISNPG